MYIKYTAFNLLGLGLPLLLAVAVIPALIQGLGAERFGLLTLIWAVVSYFGLFDLGLGRALTQQLSVLLTDRREVHIRRLVWTALLLTLALGLTAGLLLALLAPLGIRQLQGVPDIAEAVQAAYAMSWAMPFIILTSTFRGVLEAKFHFGVINVIRVAAGVWTFVAPLIVVAYYDPRLDVIAAVLTAGRVAFGFLYGYFAWRALPEIGYRPVFDQMVLRTLGVSGGWLTVTNVVSPLMGYLDRFIVGVYVSAAAVAHYATPQEIVTKLGLLPSAVTSVLFPKFSLQIAKRDPHVIVLYRKVLWMLACVLLPAGAALSIGSKLFLSIWISASFAEESYIVLGILSVAMVLNCLATIPFTVLHSAGHYRATALIHCVELPLFLIALYALTTTMGVAGAAVAWLGRIIVDSALMFLFVEWLVWPSVLAGANAAKPAQ